MMELLKRADAKGQLEKAKEWQVIELDKLELKLKWFEKPRKQMAYLMNNYPSLTRFIMSRSINRNKKLE